MSKQTSEDRELLLEAARRANWDALHGPMHLRRGEFDPSKVRISPAEEFDEASGQARPENPDVDPAGSA